MTPTRGNRVWLPHARDACVWACLFRDGPRRASAGENIAISTGMTAPSTARGWLEPIARAGFAAKGIVYLILGTLVTQAAFGAGGRITELLGEPYGRPLLALLAMGLVGYALWRFLEAFADANRKGTSPKALGVRAGYAASGVVYGSLAIYATRLALRVPGAASSIRGSAPAPRPGKPAAGSSR